MNVKTLKTVLTVVGWKIWGGYVEYYKGK